MISRLEFLLEKEELMEIQKLFSGIPLEKLANWMMR
jgi:hypothetical protein